MLFRATVERSRQVDKRSKTEMCCFFNIWNKGDTIGSEDRASTMISTKMLAGHASNLEPRIHYDQELCSILEMSGSRNMSLPYLPPLPQPHLSTLKNTPYILHQLKNTNV